MPGRHAFSFTTLAAVSCAALLALAAGCGRSAPGRDFAREADALTHAPDSLKAIALFRDWHDARPDDADAYLDEASYWLAHSQHARMAPSHKLPEDSEDIPIRDSATGKVVGSLTEFVDLDTVLTRHAGALLDPAIARFPARLDLYFAQAHIYEAIEDFDPERKVIAAAIAAARANPGALRWTRGDPLPTPAEQLVPAAVHAYARHYAEQGTALGDRRYADLAQLGAAAYPSDSLLANDVAQASKLAQHPRAHRPSGERE